MDKLVDGFFGRTFDLFLGIAASVIEFLISGFFTILNCDLSLFDTMFPFANMTMTIIRGFALGLLLVFLILNGMKIMGMPLGFEAEHPATLVIKTIIVGAVIFYAENIVYFCLSLVKIPFDDLLAIDSASELTKLAELKGGNAAIDELSENLVTMLVPTNISTVFWLNGTLVSLVIYIIVGVNLIKYLFEVAERYIIIGVLAYTAPLAVITPVSKSTHDIFKSWCKMVFGQCLLLFFNLWFIKLFASALNTNVRNNFVDGFSGGSAVGYIVYLFLLIACLKVAQRADEMLRTLGVSVAKTGGSIIDEIAGAAAIIKGAIAMPDKIGAAAGKVVGAVETGSIASAIPGMAGFTKARTGVIKESTSAMQAPAAFAKAQQVANYTSFAESISRDLNNNAINSSNAESYINSINSTLTQMNPKDSAYKDVAAQLNSQKEIITNRYINNQNAEVIRQNAPSVAQAAPTVARTPISPSNTISNAPNVPSSAPVSPPASTPVSSPSSPAIHNTVIHQTTPVKSPLNQAPPSTPKIDYQPPKPPKN